MLFDAWLLTTGDLLPQYAHFSYFYHDWLVTWPSYNRTLAHASWSYDVYTGDNTYLQMQQSQYYKSTTGANKWVLVSIFLTATIQRYQRSVILFRAVANTCSQCLTMHQCSLMWHRYSSACVVSMCSIQSAPAQAFGMLEAAERGQSLVQAVMQHAACVL
jgi:hypothetical protein